MKKINIIFILLAFWNQVVSQSFKPKQIVSGGGFEVTANGQVSYILGQSIKGGKKTVGSYNVSEGFFIPEVTPNRYNVGEIPDQLMSRGNKIGFFIYSKIIGTDATFEMQPIGSPRGDFYFSGSTGFFEYEADSTDFENFRVKFLAMDNTDTVSQTITVTIDNPLVHLDGEFFGYTSGNFGVSERGSVTYTIPITVSPGTAGMQPQLAMSYTGGGNGVMGMGWSLGGLSTISRSPQTYAQDNYIDGVDFDARDRFNLDGERLIVVNGGVYGETGTKYYTEQNTFSEITSYAEGGITTKFIVKTKSGLIKEYGGTSDSRIEAEGRTSVMFWALNKVTDDKGNYMTISYHKDLITKEYYPIQINYTANDITGLNTYNKVIFEYEERPDITENYIYGSTVRKTKRLKNIKTYYETTILREYKITYADGIQSKIINIQEFGKGGALTGETLRPINFVWEPNALFNLKPYSNKINSSEYNDDIQVIPGDWNKDGISDILHYNKTTGENTWFINDGKLGFTKLTNVINPTQIIKGDGLFFGDFNGDGAKDILWWDKTTGQNAWFIANVNIAGTFTFDYDTYSITNNEIDDGTSLYLGDYNGDGLTDFFWYDKSSGETSWYLNQYYIANQLHFRDRANNLVDHDKIKEGTLLTTGDWNADGLADVMWWNKDTGQNYWFLNVGLVDNEINFSEEETPIITSEIKGGTTIYFGDWNADGVTDLMWLDMETGKNHWFINKGDYTFESTSENPIDTIQMKGLTNAAVYFNDWNADGLTDVMWRDVETGDSKWYINEGNFKFKRKDNMIATKMMKEDFTFTFGDWKGTGKQGMLWYNKTTGENNWFTNEVKNAKLINRIIKGDSSEININYTTLVDTTVYKKYNNAIFPEMDFIAPMNVVKSYSTSNAKGGANSFAYKYEGAKLHIQGRGFRGFTKVSIKDQQTGLQNVTIHNRDFRYVGSNVVKSLQLSGDGDTLTVTDFVKDFKEYNSSYWTYTSQLTVKKFELDHSLVSEITNKNEYDNFGNLTKSIIDYGSGFSDTITNVYLNDETHWLLGRLTTAIVSRTSPGQPTIRKTRAFEYDMDGPNPTGRLLKEITEPNIPNLKIEKSYQYDNYGNIKKSITNGWNGSEIITSEQNTSFDSKGRFAINSTNALGHTTSSSYDPIFGSIISTTDPNNNTTEWQYDNFGRKIKETRPDGTETLISYLWSKDLTGAPVGALYVIDIQTTGQARSRKWYDMLDREILSESEGFAGKKVFVEKTYNETGNVEKVTDPYFETDTKYYHNYEYDIINRVTKHTAPGNIITQTIYEGLTRISINPLGQKDTVVQDILGRIIKTVDNQGNVMNFTYNSFGNILTSSDPQGNSLLAEYDLNGNKIRQVDPDLGEINFTYNAFNQLLTKTDANNNTFSYEYDLLGRTVKQTEAEGTTSYTYDTKANGVGLVATINSVNSYSKNFEYDTYSRIISKIENIDGTDYTFSNTYDANGNMNSITYPSGFEVNYTYSNYGYLDSVYRNTDNYLYWKMTDANAKGQLLNQVFGNGVSSDLTYNIFTGFISSINSSKEENSIQDLRFAFDNIGNLTQRKDVYRNLEENFTYDNLNRLTSATVVGQTALTMQYNELGNITFKSDVGTYTYAENGAGPHAVTSINGETIANTKFLTSLQGNIEYTSYNKAKSITADNKRVEIYYSYNHRRQKQRVFKDNNEILSKLYFGTLYEIETEVDTITQIHNIKANGQTIAVYKSDNQSQESTIFLHRDHIGSVQSITDKNGALLEVLSYDAWGNRRNAQTWETVNNTITTLLDRGFTGHEHLDLVNLINMNGRVYDPIIGRFTSADPFIQSQYNLQSYNRYSYVINSPLSLTDPSGFCWGICITIGHDDKPFENIMNLGSNIVSEAGRGVSSLEDAIGGDIGHELNKAGGWMQENSEEIAITAMSIYTGTYLAGLVTAGGITGTILSGAAMGFGSSFSGTLMHGGSVDQAFTAGLQSGVRSGITAGLTYGVGKQFRHATKFNNVVPKAIAHGTIQGLATEASGGKFEHGFISGAVSSTGELIPNSFTGGSFVGDITKSALIGGVSSHLSGGSFSDGAMSGTMITIFNKHGETGPKNQNLSNEPDNRTFADKVTNIAYKQSVKIPVGLIIPVVGHAIGILWPSPIATSPIEDPNSDYYK